VAELKERAQRQETPKPSLWKNLKRWSVLAGALMLSTPSLDCAKQTQKEPPAKMRCYDYQDKELKVYIEEKDQKLEAELGNERSLGFSQLEIKNGNDPLAYFCTHDGYLFWITKDEVYIRKIDLQGDSFTVGEVLNAKHTQPDEYAVSGVKVISADIWRNPEEPYEKITLATLTNTGLFQSVRYSLEAIANNDIDRGITDLATIKEGPWPKGGISNASVHVLGSEIFVIIPLGEKGKGDITVFYNLESKERGPFYRTHALIHTFALTENHPELKNIFAVTSPVRYDKSLGGWVVNLMGEKKDGTEFPIFPIVTP